VKELKSTRLLVETPVWFVAAFGESLPIAAKSIDTVALSFLRKIGMLHGFAGSPKFSE
jgi:hypothetical protein